MGGINTLHAMQSHSLTSSHIPHISSTAQNSRKMRHDWELGLQAGRREGEARRAGGIRAHGMAKAAGTCSTRKPEPGRAGASCRTLVLTTARRRHLSA